MNKSARIEERMRELMSNGTWSVNQKIPSEEELCEQFQVSRTSIRSALGVLRAERRVMSRPRVGSIVAPKTGRQPVFLVQHEGNSFFNRDFSLQATNYFARQSQYSFQAFELGSDSKEEDEKIDALMAVPDSLILLGYLRSDHTRELIRQNPRRIAILGSAPELYGQCIQIETDLQAGAEQMMDYLVNSGHRRIAFVGTYGDGKRFMAWKMKLTRAGFPPPDELAFIYPEDAPCGLLDMSCFSRDVIARLKQMNERPTAIFCMADSWAINILHAAYAAGLAVPKDFSLTGFDGIYYDLESAGGKTLTTIVQPCTKIFAETLYALEHFSGNCPHILLTPTLLKGNTVTPVLH